MTPIRIGSEGKKIVYFTAGVWYDESDGSIHMSSAKDKRFHTSFKADAESKSHHESAYKQLKGILQSYNRWPEGAE